MWGILVDAIIAANMGRKALSDLLYTCKAAAYSTESADVRNKLLSAGRDCALKYRELLHTVHMVRPFLLCNHLPSSWAGY